MFKSKRRELALALVATAVVSMLAACGGGADAPPAPRTTAWLANLLDATKERKGRPGSLGRPFNYARRAALAVHIPRLAWTDWRPLFPKLRRPRGFNSADFSLNGCRPSVRSAALVNGIHLAGPYTCQRT